jgi:hypothetical protein
VQEETQNLEFQIFEAIDAQSLRTHMSDIFSLQTTNKTNDDYNSRYHMVIDPIHIFAQLEYA